MTARRGGQPVTTDDQGSTGPRSWKVVVTGPGNGAAAWINANHRVHWAVRSRLTAGWRANAHWAARRAKVPTLRGAHITGWMHFPDARRRDAGNYQPTLKACVDGLVDAGVLEDDDDTRVIGPDARRGLPTASRRHPAKVTLVITELPTDVTA